MTATVTKDFQAQLQKVASLVEAIEAAADPAIRAKAIELIHCLMALHGAGLEQIMSVIYDDGPHGGELIDRLAGDPLVSSVLLLHDLHPLDIETRVLNALDKVRPYLQSHGGNVELLGVRDGAVRLRLQGSCHGCASSAMTLKLAIEDALYERAPDLTSLEVEGVVTPRPVDLIKIDQPQDRPQASSGCKDNGEWKDVNGLAGLADGAVRTIEVSGRTVLFCRVGTTLYAYENTCPGCGRAMNGACLEQSELICPGCQQRFETTRAGRASDPALRLEPFPLLFETSQARIALPSSLPAA